MLRKHRYLGIPALAGVLAMGLFSGCATSQTAEPATAAKPASTPAQAATAAPAPAAAAMEYYFLVFHENGRVYPIADVKNYLGFLEHDELIYTRTRIGGGPDGATLVFGIEKKEADNLAKPAKAELVYDGKYEPTGPFYGEVLLDGRFYVFGTWKDFKDFLQHKEVTYTFTDIGAGPKGETVIYALNKDTVKEGRPVKLIEAFNNLRKTK
jgi:hypothetical protein